MGLFQLMKEFGLFHHRSQGLMKKIFKEDGTI